MSELKISMEAARINAKLTQKELARRIGVSEFTIQQWESGKGIPRVDQFCDFCEAVGVSADNIVLHNDSVKTRNRKGGEPHEPRKSDRSAPCGHSGPATSV